MLALNRLQTATVILLSAGLLSCAGTTNESTSSQQAPANRDVILATTSSTYDSGLLDVLIPDFEARTAYRVKPLAVGTGKALAMAARGETNVLLVHAPSLEKSLLDSGAVVSRALVMHNYFTIVGPHSDPAEVGAQSSAANGMRMIAQMGARFISRGDGSGTQEMEMRLWDQAEVEPGGSWYQESGQGMGATLGIASERLAYTLTDLGTYIALKHNLGLEPLSDHDPALLNIYSVLEVSESRFPEVNGEGGRAFAEYLVSSHAQDIIKKFGLDRYGESLFIPSAGQSEGEIGE